jgi:hypothetical protein
MSRTGLCCLATAVLVAGCSAGPPAGGAAAPVAPSTVRGAAPVPTDGTATPLPEAGPSTEAGAEGDGFGLLKAVRVAGQGGADRIVFEFAEAVPGYAIGFVDLPVTTDPAGQEVPLDGTAALQISLIGSSAYAEVGDVQPAFPVPGRLSGDTAQVTELVNLGDVERVLVWAAGVRERTGFTVSTLPDPPRLVIDVAH